MQPYPKKSQRPLPEGWDKEETKKAMSEAYDSLFGEFTDKDGVLKITPEVIRTLRKQFGSK